MAKTYHFSVNNRRKYCDRKGFAKNKLPKKNILDNKKYECIKDCIDCPNNITCSHLSFM